MIQRPLSNIHMLCTYGDQFHSTWIHFEQSLYLQSRHAIRFYFDQIWSKLYSSLSWWNDFFFKQQPSIPIAHPCHSQHCYWHLNRCQWVVKNCDWKPISSGTLCHEWFWPIMFIHWRLPVASWSQSWFDIDRSRRHLLSKRGCELPQTPLWMSWLERVQSGVQMLMMTLKNTW